MSQRFTLLSTRIAAGSLKLVGALGVLAVMSTEAWAQTKRWAPNAPASDYGHRHDSLFNLITWLVSISFLLVLILMLIPVLRDRARPGRRAHYDHGRSLHDKRFAATVSATVFIVLDAWVLVVAMKDLREGFYNIPAPEDDGVMLVEVQAQQWSWNFRTPGIDGEFGTPDDVVTINELTVPEGQAVSLNLTSKDVIHSFFLPDMRFKRDLNPGAVNLGWFRPILAGDFEILCAELCGYAHYRMLGELHVLEQSEFDTWYTEASRMAEIGYDAEDEEAHWAWDWRTKG